MRPRHERLEPRRLLDGGGLRVDHFADPLADVLDPDTARVAAEPVLTTTGPAAGFWGEGAPAALPADGFTSRYAGTLAAPAAGAYTFRVRGGDPARLTVGGARADDWAGTGRRTARSLTVTLDAGQRVALRLDHHDDAGDAAVRLDWSVGGSPESPVPAGVLSPFSDAAVIDEPGLYVGSWRSDDHDRPAVRVTTTGPVEVARSHTLSRGDHFAGTGVDLTVRDTLGEGLRPDVAGRSTGRFVRLVSPARLVVLHNRLVSTAGIFAQDAPDLALLVAANDARNIDGRHGDGVGYGAGFDRVQFLQLDHVTAPAGHVAWNRVVNEPGASRVEDVVNLYHSGGTEAAPLRVRHNLIDGAYTAAPTSEVGGEEFYGGGILVGDVPLGPGRGGHVVVERNSVTNAMNHGVAVAGGRGHVVRQNIVRYVGTLPDGTPVPQRDDVGIYAWDSYGVGGMSGNVIEGNAVFVESGGRRNDYWLPDADEVVGNDTLPREFDVVAHWQRHAKRAQVTPGVR